MKLHSTEHRTYTDFLTDNTEVIKTYINSQLIEPINLDTFEGGLTSWFGPGSVTVYELGLTIGLIHNHLGTTLVLE